MGRPDDQCGPPTSPPTIPATSPASNPAPDVAEALAEPDAVAEGEPGEGGEDDPPGVVGPGEPALGRPPDVPATDGDPRPATEIPKPSPPASPAAESVGTETGVSVPSSSGTVGRGTGRPGAAGSGTVEPRIIDATITTAAMPSDAKSTNSAALRTGPIARPARRREPLRAIRPPFPHSQTHALDPAPTDRWACDHPSRGNAPRLAYRAPGYPRR